ncbi:MAG: ABC transporter ATP-binding protein/permease [Acetatifactor sp.]|nr:ABC transporter ATP-binding protein/permease [Acetatifactor sp.]
MKYVPKEERLKTKQSVKTVLANNFYVLRLIFAASPSFVLYQAADAVRGQVSIFFEHTVLIGYVLEAAEFGYPFERVATVILLLAALITIGMFFTVYQSSYVAPMEEPKVREKIKMKLYEKARDMDLECYDDPEFYNSQVLAISQIDEQIGRVIRFLIDTLSGLAAFVTTAIYFIYKDKTAILFAIGAFVLSLIFEQLYNKQNYLVRIESIAASRRRDYVKRIYYLNDYAKEIRLNPNVSDILIDRFEKANDEVYAIEKKYAMKKWFFGFMRRYIANSFVADVLFIGYLVYQAAVLHSISFSTVAILYGSYGRLKNSMRVFSETYPFACETSLYVSKIREFLNYEPKIVSKENLVPTYDAKEIELDKVSFAYGKNQEMLIKDLSLHVKPGEKIALVGYNGAGKTTLVKLLMRLYDTKGGVIKVDGRDIKEYDAKKYRETIGTVFQDFQIFAGTVKENVVLDVADHAEEDGVRRALSESGLLERIGKFEKGLDTELTTEFSREGVNLSGGESQKLAISRVFYKNAGLMILDEPSSALDPIAEYQLNHAMLEATGDKTVIFISHRLSTTRIADRIIMLEKGSIVEQGTHEELLAMDGKYAQMWKVQAGAYIAV